MNQLIVYNDMLKAQFELRVQNYETDLYTNIVCLDAIDAVLRRHLAIDQMKEAGSFFTGEHLAIALVNRFKKTITYDSVIIDPTCGAGNLLIECSRRLKVEDTLKATLVNWGQVLRGYDIHAPFIESAKLRLIFEALNRGAKKDCTLAEALAYFRFIKVEDVMHLDCEIFHNATHIVMNPPFFNWPSPSLSFWKKGKVNAAGVVFERILNLLPECAEISALLPDVLRSGSRYEEWRKYVGARIEGDCDIYGRFNPKTDVDVFFLSGHKRFNIRETILWNDVVKNSKIIDDYFNVCVGSLVSYRSPLSGKEYPYIHAKIAPPWETITAFEERRQFSGKVYQTPLLIIRRTSSPRDKFRAVGTLVTCDEYVAIENHLIVLQPKDGKLTTCQNLLEVLKTDYINNYLNKRIRLRHLTVGVIKEIPFG